MGTEGTAYANDSFEFKAILKNGNNQMAFPENVELKIGGTKVARNVTGDVWTFNLTGGQNAVFSGLPLGSTLVVTETENTNYTTTVNNARTNTIEIAVEAASMDAKYVNTLKPTSVTIKKTVSGNMADVNKAFEFTVTMDKACKDAGGATVTSKTFSLKHGQTYTFTEVPVGTKFTVEEESGKYTASAKLNASDIAMSNDKTEFVVADTTADELVVDNHYEATIDAGISMDALPYILILAIAMVGGAFLLLRKRKIA